MRLAIFDYNGTIFPQETLRFLLKEWRDQNCSRLRYYKIYLSVLPLYLRYKAGFNFSLSKEEMERRAVEKFSRIFKGMEKDEIQEFFIRAERTARKYYNQEIVREIENVKQKDYHTVLLSGAFSCFLQQAAKGLGIETIIGSKLGLDNHRYNPGTGMEIISGSNKLARLKEKFKETEVEWGKSRAFADSIHDLPLLEAVGNPVAVDPDQKLERAAVKKGWEIIYTE